MRRTIVPDGAEVLTYEIREIVVVANELKKYGLKLTYENIGDPVAKGEKIQPWIKDIMKDIIDNDYQYPIITNCRKHVNGCNKYFENYIYR